MTVGGCQTWPCSSNVKHRRIQGVKVTSSVWRFTTLYNAKNKHFQTAVCAEVLSVLDVCAQQDLGDVLCSHIGQSCLEEASNCWIWQGIKKEKKKYQEFYQVCTCQARRGG